MKYTFKSKYAKYNNYLQMQLMIHALIDDLFSNRIDLALKLNSLIQFSGKDYEYFSVCFSTNVII